MIVARKILYGKTVLQVENVFNARLENILTDLLKRGDLTYREIGAYLGFKIGRPKPIAPEHISLWIEKLGIEKNKRGMRKKSKSDLQSAIEKIEGDRK